MWRKATPGTRIRVWDVHGWHNLRGQSPEQIVADFPPPSLADVHAALAYYFDHREEIQRQAKEDEVPNSSTSKASRNSIC
jgi:uncharacterized protein (DUF433 family)